MAEEIKHLEGGQFVWGYNETSLIAIRPRPDAESDPPKQRQGHEWRSGDTNCLGADSFNIVTFPDGRDHKARQEELVLVMGAVDERFDGRDGRPLKPCGEFRILCRRPSADNSDGDMIPVAEFKHDKVVFLVPVEGADVSPAPAPSGDPFRLVTPGKELSLEMQSDGGLVLYDYRVNPPKAIGRVTIQRF